MTSKKYTEEEEIRAAAIAEKDKSEWGLLIHKMADDTNRTYATVWQKVYAISKGGDKARRKKARGKSGPKVKKAHVKKSPAEKAKLAKYKRDLRKRKKEMTEGKPSTPGSYKRKSHESPLKRTHMTVSPNEVRFPIHSLRIEAGELIVTFK